MAAPPHDEWVQGNSAGVLLQPVDKLLLHTTEGTSIKGACGAYQTNNSWPHLTVDCMFGHTYKRCGHLDMDQAARSLRNLSGGVQTNLDGVIQIEVVGFATRPHEIDWTWLGANVVAPIVRRIPTIPLVSTVTWVAYPASYGAGAAQRLSGAGWSFYRGILGHQHAPENLHGDPGLIPIDTIIAAATTPSLPPPPPEDLMPFPVIGAPTDQADRPWRALLPGKVVTFVNTDPLPESTLHETFAPSWAYQTGTACGVFEPMHRCASDVQYDQAVAVAQQYMQLPGTAGPKGDKGDPGEPGADGADGQDGVGLPASFHAQITPDPT
jgi:hypothetical protein